MKTWIVELAVVWVVLIGVVYLTRGGLLEALGALAVLAAFAHAQVAERMREKEALKSKPDVHCHRWITRYFFAKELLWCSYFVAHRSWAALAGVGVFLLYPLWRKWWRALHPLAPNVRKLLHMRRIEEAVQFEVSQLVPLSVAVEVSPTVTDRAVPLGTIRVQLSVGGGR